MKVKCVSNIGSNGELSDYLTTGKTYDAIFLDDHECLIEDDNGLQIWIGLVMSHHGKFEVIK